MAGRQIKPSKGAGELYDAGRGHVCAERIQPLPNNLKKKISLILEAIPSKSKSEIAEVLQSCDYDVDTALNCFIADGEMDGQNEWKVQGKRKARKKRKSSGKKAAKEANDAQSQDGTENSSVTDQKLDEKPEEGHQKTSKNIPTEEAPKAQPTGKDNPTTTNKQNLERTNKDNLKSLENLKPVSNDVSTPLEATPTPTSPSLSPPLLSPTDSVKSSQDSQTLNKNRAGHSANEKHPRVRTTSGSGSEVIKRSFKDLQRSSVSIARYQSMLDEQAESSTKMLAKSFQALRQALDEREKYLKDELESVIEEAKKLLEDRQEDAAHLSFKCNRVGSMTDEETTELRSEIKNFVGERRIDEDLGKTVRFQRDEEKMLEVVKNFGEVPPIKQRYTPYKRKEPSTGVSGKPPPVKATPASSNVSTTTTTTTTTTSSSTTTTTTTTTSSSRETKSGNHRNEKRPVLSPSRLKDQAEMHAKLQQAVKEQQVTPTSKESSKQADRNASEKPKPKDFGPKPSRNNNSKGQQGNNAHREQNPQRQRQTSASHYPKKSTGNRKENISTNSENSKNEARANGVTKAQDTKPADGVSKTQDDAPAVNGMQTQEGNTTNTTPAQQDKSAKSDQVMPANQGNQRSRRRYVRKTPPSDGSPIFRTGAVDTANTSSAKVNGNNNESKSNDLPKPQLENKMANGTNDFVPLPQRSRRPRKVFYKKDPNSKIEFPPNRENGSVRS